MNLDTTTRPSPKSLGDLFWSMTWLALPCKVLVVVSMLLVWETNIHLLWLLGAGALLGAFG